MNKEPELIRIEPEQKILLSDGFDRDGNALILDGVDGLIGELYSIEVAHTDNVRIDGSVIKPRKHIDPPDKCWCWKEPEQDFPESWETVGGEDE